MSLRIFVSRVHAAAVMIGEITGTVAPKGKRMLVLRLPNHYTVCKDAAHIIRAGHLFGHVLVDTICPLAFRDCLDVAIKLDR